MLFRWSILIAVIPNTNHKLLRLAVLLVLAVFILFHSFYLEQWSVKLAHLTKSGISYLCWVLTNKHILQRPCQNSLSRSSTPGPSTEPTRPGWVMTNQILNDHVHRTKKNRSFSSSEEQGPINSFITSWLNSSSEFILYGVDFEYKLACQNKLDHSRGILTGTTN